MSVFSYVNERNTIFNMQLAIVLCAIFAAASAGYINAPTTLVRTPAFDSAHIKSDRLGGNFAYSTSEGHAYAAVSPVVQNVVAPVGVSYSAHTVATPGVAYAAPAVAYSAPAVSYAAPAVAYSGAYAAPAAYAYGAYNGYNTYGAYPYGAGVVAKYY